MKILPSYQITPEILEMISKVDALRLFFASIDIPLSIKQKIQRVSLLKSSLFSARIEGNPLQFDEMEQSSNKLKKMEIVNILHAQNYIEKEIQKGKKLTVSYLKKIHSDVLKEISPDAGKLRTEPGAIFNQAGVAVYLSPPPTEIIPLLEELMQFINSENENFPLICALVSHLAFEKIHPFIDGNGRVGRLLIYAILKSKGYECNLTIPFEEYLDEHKELYYMYIDSGLTNTNDYLVYMLRAYLAEAEKVRKELERELSKKDHIYLPPRQEELYEIIKDHKMVSFDQIKRRFLKVPARTLRYDLSKLAAIGLIVKVGKTRGSLYCCKNDNIN